MLINIEGTLIDTSKIYKISPIQGNRYFGTARKALQHSGYFFEIHFLNQKSHKVELNGYTVFHSNITDEEQICLSRLNLWWQTDEKTYLERCEIIKNKLKKAYDELVSYVNLSDSNIPEIKII